MAPGTDDIAVTGAIKNLRNVFRMLAGKYVVARGLGTRSELPLALLWSGPASHLAYFQTRFFEVSEIGTAPFGRHAITSLSKLLDRSDVPLGLVVVKRHLAETIKSPADLILPLWIDCDVTLDKERTHNKSDSLRGDLRNIRKNGFVWKISTRRTDFEHFFDRLYKPTLAESHGRSALPANRDDRSALIEAGKMELLQVSRGDQIVAGVTIDYRGPKPELRDSGVLDGAIKLKRAGAVTATYIFAMDYLASKSFSTVGFGRTRGFLNDGVLVYKRKFRPVIVPGPDDCVLIRVAKLDAAARAMLCSCPCITWQGNELQRTYFEDASSDPSGKALQKLRSGWSFGIEKETVYDVSGQSIQLVDCS